MRPAAGSRCSAHNVGARAGSGVERDAAGAATKRAGGQAPPDRSLPGGRPTQRLARRPLISGQHALGAVGGLGADRARRPGDRRRAGRWLNLFYAPVLDLAGERSTVRSGSVSCRYDPACGRAHGAAMVAAPGAGVASAGQATPVLVPSFPRTPIRSGGRPGRREKRYWRATSSLRSGCDRAGPGGRCLPTSRCPH